MTLRHRLRRLETSLRKDGCRCPLCRDRPGQVLVTTADNERGDWQPCPGEPKGDSPEATAVCPACGWQPEVVQVTEVVVHSRAQWEQIRRNEQQTEEPSWVPPKVPPVEESPP